MILIKTQAQLVLEMVRLLTTKPNNLKDHEFVVFMFLCDKVNHTHIGDTKWCCFYSQEQIASLLGKSRRTIIEIILSLKDKGYISYEKGNPRKANLYKINVERIGIMFDRPMMYCFDTKPIRNHNYLPIEDDGFNLPFED